MKTRHNSNVWMLVAIMWFAGLSSCTESTLPVEVPSAAPDSGPGVELTFLANEGVMIQGGGAKVLIDAFVGEPYSIYGALPADVAQKLGAAKAPFDDVDLALVSHVHRDHFQAATACKFLSASAGTHFTTSPQVIEGVRESCEGDHPAAPLPTEPGATSEHRVGAVQVTSLALSHGTGRFASIQNLGHVIELGGMKILHVGDAAMNPANFVPYDLASKHIDVALVPYWYFQDANGRKIVADHFHADSLVAVHIPPGELDEVRDSLAGPFPDLHVFTESMQSKRYAPKLP